MCLHKGTGDKGRLLPAGPGARPCWAPPRESGHLGNLGSALGRAVGPLPGPGGGWDVCP